MKRIFLLIFMFCCGTAFTQRDSLLLSKIAELKILFEEYEYTPMEFKDTSLVLIREISNIEDLNQFPDRAVYLQKRAEQLRKDIGLNAAGSYVENFNADPSEGLENNIGYQRRVQAGVEWEVLSGGYSENRVRAQMIDDRILREKLSNDIAKESQYYVQRFDQTVFAFNRMKLNLLEIRLVELEKQHSLVRDLVFLKKLKKEQLIKVEIRLAEVESLINVYKSYNDYLGIEADSVDFMSKDLPLIDLDYDAIFKLVGVQTDSLLAGGVDYLEYFKWYHEVGLRPFARYNYYDIITGDNRQYFSAGVNVTVPLSFNTKLNNEVEHEKWKYENERFTRDRAQLHEDVLNTAYEFRYQMKRFVDNYQTRKLISERLRIEKAKMRLSEISGDPFKGLDLLDELMESDIELLELLQGLYLKALKIHTKIPGVKIDDIIKSQSAGDLFEYVKTRKRDVYIWSKTFENYTGDFLAEYAVYNEFGKMIVAVSDKDVSKEKKLFMQYASESSEVYFMLGNNKLFYNTDITGYLERVLKNYDKTTPTGIHLDIEPHTFDNWEKDRRNLLNKYVVLVAEVSRFCKKNDLKLEISVPKHYDTFIMNQLFQLVDKVYFMCYENVDTDFLVRKISPFMEEYADKVVIALRTEDFNNRLEMENKIDELQKRLDLDEFAYHDLQRIISFDKRGRQ
ncbi:MAG: hypothetical protein GQ574_01940 [Crocinitomix sp.]|nr:hypothetical protein [Crocinitomix sp.]